MFSTASTSPPDRKVGGQFGHLVIHPLLHPPHVLEAADFVVVFQADLHEGGVQAGIGGVDAKRSRGSCRCWRRSSPGLPANTVFRIRFSTLAISFSVTSIRVPVGAFTIDDELAGIGAREEGHAELREQQEVAAKATAEGHEGQHRAAQRHSDQPVVDSQEALEMMVEPNVEALAERLARLRG